MQGEVDRKFLDGETAGEVDRWAVAIGLRARERAWCGG